MAYKAYYNRGDGKIKKHIGCIMHSTIYIYTCAYLKYSKGRKKTA